MERLDVEVAARFKVEIALLVASVFMLMKILLFMPAKLGQFKEIFMGMNVELPPITVFVLGFADLVMGWWFIAWPLFTTLGLVLLFSGTRAIIKAGKASFDKGKDSLAWLEIGTCSTLVIILLSLLALEGVIMSAVFGPMMRLTNAF